MAPPFPSDCARKVMLALVVLLRVLLLRELLLLLLLLLLVLLLDAMGAVMGGSDIWRGWRCCCLVCWSGLLLLYLLMSLIRCACSLSWLSRLLQKGRLIVSVSIPVVVFVFVIVVIVMSSMIVVTVVVFIGCFLLNSFSVFFFFFFFFFLLLAATVVNSQMSQTTHCTLSQPNHSVTNKLNLWDDDPSFGNRQHAAAFIKPGKSYVSSNKNPRNTFQQENHISIRTT
jgi:hypothetical protein